jgi:ketosteroid isomerase-like protein
MERFNAGDRDGLASLTAPSVEIVPMRAALEGTVYSGENAVAEFWQAIDETWEETLIDGQEFHERGDQVLLTGRLRGRAKGTEVEVDSPMAWLLTFERGKVKALRTYTDVAEARAAVGLDA